MVFFFLQVILRQLGQISNEPLMIDESEIECHQQLQKLYTSTKTAKVFFNIFTPCILFNWFKKLCLVMFLTNVLLDAHSIFSGILFVQLKDSFLFAPSKWR